jgi:predicted Holliday junction resolvase-like endonuclease
MMVNNSVTGALVLLVITTLVIGLVAGLAISNSDLVNPYRNRAEAERIRQEAALQAQREAIDLQTYQREQELRLQALEQQQADERAYRQAWQETKLSFLRTAGTTVVITVDLTLLILAIALALRLIAQARHVWIQSSAQVQTMREQMRRLARENERLTRRLNLLEQEMALTEGGNGHRKESAVCRA